MEIKVNLRGYSFLETNNNNFYTIEEDFGDVEPLVKIMPMNEYIYLNKEGIRDLLAVLNMFYQRYEQHKL